MSLDQGLPGPLILDPDNWKPLSVDRLAALFRECGAPWWIAGGWALDLFLGRQSREHEDTDVLILRKDQSVVREHLKGWQLFKTKSPGLAPWPQGEYLDLPVNSIWVRPEGGDAWAFEIMLMETEEDDWIYRREPSIRGRIADMGMVTEAGIPYLVPEIQLLYKSKPNREKDREDLRRVLPHLSPERIQWLLSSLRAHYTNGHEWIEHIERFSL